MDRVCLDGKREYLVGDLVWITRVLVPDDREILVGLVVSSTSRDFGRPPRKVVMCPSGEVASYFDSWLDYVQEVAMMRFP